MDSYCVQKTSGTTFSNVVALTSGIGLIIGLAAAQAPAIKAPKQAIKDVVSFERNLSSYGHYADPYSGGFRLKGDGGFELAVADFYSQLLAHQEPLGAEFERVLYDNLDSLLIRV